jgi:beta-glucosidase
MRITLQLAFFLVLILVRAGAQTAGGALYLDPSQPINVRVDDLIKRMTLEQKATQLVNQARAIPDLNVPAYD